MAFLDRNWQCPQGPDVPTFREQTKMPTWKHETINTLVHVRFISKNKSTGKLFRPTGHWSFLGLKHLKPSNHWSTSNGICWIYAKVILHHIPTSTVAPVFWRQHPMATFTGKTSSNCWASHQKKSAVGPLGCLKYSTSKLWSLHSLGENFPVLVE